MESLRFSVDVGAPAQHVWNVMLDLDTYREWTGAFHEGSTYEGSWNEGDEIRFLGPNADGTASGLFGTIVENRPHEFVSIRYLGDIENDVENRAGPAVGLHESYSFSETDGVTTLVVELEVPDEWADDMRGMWAEAIVTIKRLAEQA
ncbi:SRPBCC domain-containing protein [Cryobacterium sp. PH31-L1]|uniref:SRPBCC family protein n=1 Tax=Cryobacterium sp. PH31-L1 TaxID=3046199 RepID=UPI0024BB5B37|nr:SRPBCC domain-containing protein [Cryobacterium sp. PH31-L1]MDJ0377072.1 SRPBCC domain-containing protein [Cryobacterium sp. PH31-L1]